MAKFAYFYVNFILSLDCSAPVFWNYAEKIFISDRMGCLWDIFVDIKSHIFLWLISDGLFGEVI